MRAARNHLSTNSNEEAERSNSSEYQIAAAHTGAPTPSLSCTFSVLSSRAGHSSHTADLRCDAFTVAGLYIEQHDQGGERTPAEAHRAYTAGPAALSQFSTPQSKPPPSDPVSSDPVTPTVSACC